MSLLKLSKKGLTIHIAILIYNRFFLFRICFKLFLVIIPLLYNCHFKTIVIAILVISICVISYILCYNCFNKGDCIMGDIVRKDKMIIIYRETKRFLNDITSNDMGNKGIN